MSDMVLIDDTEIEAELRTRAANSCELCSSEEGLAVLEVSRTTPTAVSADTCVLLCRICAKGCATQQGLDDPHWNCLRQSAWSETVAIQVLSWRLLGLLTSAWAIDLRSQIYLDDDAVAWAEESGLGSVQDLQQDDDVAPTLDCNGSELADGDAVTIIKDLDVKGTGFVAKRGTLVKNIRLTGDPKNIEGRVNKTTLVLKTEFVRKK